MSDSRIAGSGGFMPKCGRVMKMPGRTRRRSQRKGDRWGHKCELQVRPMAGWLSGDVFGAVGSCVVRKNIPKTRSSDRISEAYWICTESRSYGVPTHTEWVSGDHTWGLTRNALRWIERMMVERLDG